MLSCGWLALRGMWPSPRRDERLVAWDVYFQRNYIRKKHPIRIPPNQVGLNYNTIPPTLPIPTVVAKSKAVSKTFNIKNTGIKSVQIDW